MSVLGRVRAVNARRAVEDSISLRGAVLVAVMAAAVATLRQGVGGPALWGAVLIGLPGAYVYSYCTRRREGFGLKVLLALGLLAAFAHFLASATSLEAGAAVSQAQVPLAELFLWVQVLHGFDLPARRDLMFSLAASAALLGVACVLSTSVGIAPWIALWAAAGLTSLTLTERRAHAELATLCRDPPRDAASGGRGRRRPAAGVRAVVRPVAAGLLALALVGLAVFMVVPEAGTARALLFPTRLPRAVSVPVPGGLENPAYSGSGEAGARAGSSGGVRAGTGYFGFETSLDTARRGRPDHTVVMRVRSSRPDFWRGQSFDHFDGRTWTQTQDRPRAIRSDSPISLPRAGDDPVTGGDDLVQTYYLALTGPNIVFGAYEPQLLYFPQRTVFTLPDGALRAGVQMEKGTVYTVVSRRPPATPAALRSSALSGERLPPDEQARYTQLPAVSPRVTQLAASVTAGAATPYDAVLALEGWMAAHTTYTLDVPPLPPGTDTVDEFLFGQRKGFCEQIATSLTVLLRSVGIPARLAVGYAPGRRNPFTGLYEVRASDAHAWTEVWFPGYGWQPFDPTARVPLAGDQHATAAGAGILAYLGGAVPHVDRRLLAVLGALAGTAVLAAGALVVRRRRTRRARRGEPRPPTWAETGLARLDALGEAHGRPRLRSETPREHARALRGGVLAGTDGAAELAAVADLIDAGLFGVGPPDPEGHRRADAALEAARLS